MICRDSNDIKDMSGHCRNLEFLIIRMMLCGFTQKTEKVKPALMAKEMVQSGQLPDGIVCYNDQIAVQVMEELEKQGIKIPDDISITGYDNSLYAQRGNGITTIAHPQEKLGEMAAELILEKINGIPEEESKVERLIHPELIVRGSCKKA